MGGDQESSKVNFDDEEFEAVSPVNQPRAEIKPGDLIPRHRIGRGPFGDVWIGTLHSHREEFDEHHEVAVKVLPPLGQDHVDKFSGNIEDIFSRKSLAVSWPLGYSVKERKVSVITKLYETSVADKMARNPENRLPLDDVLRYGTDLAGGVLELHSLDMLALNLKPSNVLIDEQDQAVLGEFGIPFLLMDAISKNGPLLWLGTPNYMAPEQWDAKLRGPVSFQTDSWGFACTLVEMITGIRPWNHMTPGDIFQAVVVRREKPLVPPGIPSALQKVLKDCFSYDCRDRPTMSEIEVALKCPHIIFREADWVAVSHKQGVRIGVVNKVKGSQSLVVQHCDKPEELVEYTGLSRCSIWTPFQVGDKVRPKTLSWSQDCATITEVDKDKASFKASFEGIYQPFEVDPAQLELVHDGICVGDWVRLREDWPIENTATGTGTSTGHPPSRTGIVHRISDSRDVVSVAFLGRPTSWEGSTESLTKVATPPVVGQFVRLKNEVVAPRLEWPVKRNQSWETGRIFDILPNGGLVVDFPGRFWNRKLCFADVEEVEIVRLNECTGIVDKYEHLQAMHWAIAPALYLLGFLAAARVGTVVGSFVIAPLSSKRKKQGTNHGTTASSSSSEGYHHRPLGEYHGETKMLPPGAGNPVWLPPAVANILFKEGGSSTTTSTSG